MSNKPHYIVVEGPIGVGKTTLAKRLADDFDAELLLESVSDNPFLQQFYANRESAALATQLHFLLTRLRQLEGLQQQQLFRPVQVTDFLLEKDRLFAENTLNPLEFTLYERIYEKIAIDLPRPDLVVYLQAPVEILHKRIKKRGRNFEGSISTAYLQQLVTAYTNFFHYYDLAPLLVVNATEIDLVKVEEDYQALLRQVQTIHSGRHYFNPLPSGNRR